jgi:hypothetical protein
MAVDGDRVKVETRRVWRKIPFVDKGSSTQTSIALWRDGVLGRRSLRAPNIVFYDHAR